MKKVVNWFAASWMNLVYAVVVAVGVVFLLWFGLGDMLPGLSEKEAAQAVSANTVQKLIDNPIGLPHKAVQFATGQLLTGGAAVRSASALLGLFTLGCFYYVLRSWYTRRVAVLGTLTFATSAWFLHVARLGTDSSMYLLLFGAVACVIWLQRSRGSIPALAVSAFFVITLLYIPGMIWFVVPALLWQIDRISETLRHRNPAILTLLSFLVFVALVPIGWAMYQQPDLIKTYFGLPQAMPDPLQIAKNIAHIPVQLFARGPSNPEQWLGRLPLLNLFVSIMFAIGLYAYFQNRKLDRVGFMLFVLVAGGLLASIGGPVNLAIMLPFLYLVTASGMAHMLQKWFTVFPLNPFARTTGTILMTIVVLLAAFNGFSHYFIAWPNTPGTKSVFQQKP
ncbi:MAG TPA: hypothetical protein VK674_06915 [Candidatus Limnocylindria bacterium]|nr:hypothetical protein [Candidatus Limnocylindria bacterium]